MRNLFLNQSAADSYIVAQKTSLHAYKDEPVSLHCAHFTRLTEIYEYEGEDSKERVRGVLANYPDGWGGNMPRTALGCSCQASGGSTPS